MEEMQEQEGMQEGAPAEGGDLNQFLGSIAQGIQTLGKIVGATEGAPPEAMAAIDQMMGGLENVINIMSGGAPAGGKSKMEPVQQAEGVPAGPQG